MQEGSKNEINSNFPKLEAAKLCLPSAILLFGMQCTKKQEKYLCCFVQKVPWKLFFVDFYLDENEKS